MSPKVSAVVTTYNRTTLLRDAIESVLAQTFEDFECIVVDDASDEDSQSVVEEFDDERLRFVEHEQNRGLSTARNTGVDASSGKYVAFLDDDDQWLPTKLEKQVELLDDSPEEVAFVYCWMDYCSYANGKYRQCHPTLDGDIFEEVLDRQRITNGSTLLVRRDIFDKVGGFDESLSRGIDGDFIRRVAVDFEVRYVPEVLVEYYTDHGNNRITNMKPSGVREHIYGTEVKFEKFGPELRQLPRRAARIHADLGYHYAYLGNLRESVRRFARAFRTLPYEPVNFLWLYKTFRLVPERLIGGLGRD